MKLFVLATLCALLALAINASGLHFEKKVLGIDEDKRK